MDPTEPRPTAVVLAFAGCILAEVLPAVAALRARGVDVVFATADGASIAGLDTPPTFRFADLATAVAVLIPGGDVYDPVHDPGVHDALRRLAALEDAPVLAGICNGALVLAAARLVDGRRCTHVGTEVHAPGDAYATLREVCARLFAGAEVVDEDLVVDGRVVTAKPWATGPFADAIVGLLDA